MPRLGGKLETRHITAMEQKFTAHKPRPAKRPKPGVPQPVAQPVSRAQLDAAAEAKKARPGPDREADKQDPKAQPDKANMPKELGGPSGLEPTRYGDWERKGICSDF